MTDDLIGSDRERSRVPAMVAGGVALVVAAGLVGDRVWQSREVSGLQACVITAEADLVDLTRRAAGIELYAGPSLTSPAVAESVRRSLAGLVQASVARDLPRSRLDRARCADLRVLSWHDQASAARRDYLAYLDLRVAQLTRATTDRDALHEVPDAAVRERALAALARVGVKVPTISP